MGDSAAYILLGIVQGLTEFLPVSSTGHLILVRETIGLFDHGLAVDAVLQLATALAVALYFWRDGISLLRRPGTPLTAALLIGTIPAVLAGLVLEDTMATLFRSPELVAYALIFGSLVMLGGEYVLKHRARLKDFRAFDWRDGLIVGLFQTLALVPGMSRSGMTIAGGLYVGFDRTAAARFAFLLSVPILAGSGLKKLYDLGSEGFLATAGFEILLGFGAAFVAGLMAIHLLMLLVRRTPLTVFVAYRLILAAVILAIL